MGRRQFLFGAAAGAAVLAGGGLGDITPLEAGNLRIRHYHIPIKDLPEAFHGLRLIHVSDTHFGPFVSMAYLKQSVKVANQLHGDLIILTGDYMHRTPRSLEPGIKVLAGLKAKYGSVAVLGNHDHWEGTERSKQVFAEIGVPLVDNHRIFLTPEGLTARVRHPELALCLAGLGDLWADDVLPGQALEGVPREMPRIILSHNPDTAEMMNGHRVDLMLSGHTHGGQVRIPLYGPPKCGKYGRKYIGGLCHGPSCPVVVSRGVGMSGVPVRLGVPPELGVITLLKA